MESNDNQKINHGLYYHKFEQFLIKCTLPPLENSFNEKELLKNNQMKKLSNEDLNEIKHIFSETKNMYIKGVLNRINIFFNKYKLDEKLDIKSEAFLLQVFLKEISFDLNKLQNMELINEIKEPELITTKKYMTEELKEKNSQLKIEIEELKKKLENLKQLNKIKLN